MEKLKKFGHFCLQNVIRGFKIEKHLAILIKMKKGRMNLACVLELVQGKVYLFNLLRADMQFKSIWQPARFAGWESNNLINERLELTLRTFNRSLLAVINVRWLSTLSNDPCNLLFLSSRSRCSSRNSIYLTRSLFIQASCLKQEYFFIITYNQGKFVRNIL